MKDLITRSAVAEGMKREEIRSGSVWLDAERFGCKLQNRKDTSRFQYIY
jgi:hypothetical protein